MSFFSNNFKNFNEVVKFSKEHNLKINYNDSLYLLRYNRYNEKCDLTDEVIQKLRGTIFDKKTNKCVCYTFNMGKN